MPSKHLGCVWMQGNGGKEREHIWWDEETLVWITKWEGRDLEGRDWMNGFC